MRHIYQLKIHIMDSRPNIWRRLLIANHLTFKQLHDAIQDSFYWKGYHLHEFSFRNPESPLDVIQIFMNPDEDPDAEVSVQFSAFFEEEIRLSDVFSLHTRSVKYIYDLGDRWELKIRLEKIFPNDDRLNSFICVGGRRAAPPEDCGGVWRYNELMDILKDPSHPEHEDMKEWVDDDFDPEIIRAPMRKMTPKQIELEYGPSIYP